MVEERVGFDKKGTFALHGTELQIVSCYIPSCQHSFDEDFVQKKPHLSLWLWFRFAFKISC